MAVSKPRHALAASSTSPRCQSAAAFQAGRLAMPSPAFSAAATQPLSSPDRNRILAWYPHCGSVDVHPASRKRSASALASGRSSLNAAPKAEGQDCPRIVLVALTCHGKNWPPTGHIHAAGSLPKPRHRCARLSRGSRAIARFANALLFHKHWLLRPKARPHQMSNIVLLGQAAIGQWTDPDRGRSHSGSSRLTVFQLSARKSLQQFFGRATSDPLPLRLRGPLTYQPAACATGTNCKPQPAGRRDWPGDPTNFSDRRSSRSLQTTRPSSTPRERGYQSVDSRPLVAMLNFSA